MIDTIYIERGADEHPRAQTLLARYPNAVCIPCVGYQVVGISRQPERAGIAEPDFIPVSLDLGRLVELPGRLEQIGSQHPDIRAIVANAGQGRFGGLEEFSYSQISGLVDLNLTSSIYLTRALLPAMKRRGGGDLVFIGSSAAVATPTRLGRAGRQGTHQARRHHR